MGRFAVICVLGDLLRAIWALYQVNEACVEVDGEVWKWFR